jgi:predicted metal-dependent HD superfamily phosphohydrolase
MAAVEVSWNQLCEDLDLPASLVTSWWKRIVTEYTRPYRHYHTLQHLSEFLGHYYEHQALISDHRSFLLAIFFHDLVYEPSRSMNEDDSIHLFKIFATDCHQQHAARSGVYNQSEEDKVAKLSAQVIKLIELTKAHQCQDTSLDSQLFCDMDMAILGASPERYREYSEQVHDLSSFTPHSLHSIGAKRVLPRPPCPLRPETGRVLDFLSPSALFQLLCTISVPSKAALPIRALLNEVRAQRPAEPPVGNREPQRGGDSDDSQEPSRPSLPLPRSPCYTRLHQELEVSEGGGGMGSMY